MKKIILLITIVLSCFMLVSCENSDNEFYEITGYDTVGVIKDYDKNEQLDMLTEKMLKKQLSEMKGEAVFARTEILGEESGKVYVLSVYAGYEKVDDNVKCTSIYNELAEFDDINDDNYKSLSGQNAVLNKDSFLPESITKKKGIENFDWYTYQIGKWSEELKLEAEEYFEVK